MSGPPSGSIQEHVGWLPGSGPRGPDVCRLFEGQRWRCPKITHKYQLINTTLHITNWFTSNITTSSGKPTVKITSSFTSNLTTNSHGLVHITKITFKGITSVVSTCCEVGHVTSCASFCSSAQPIDVPPPGSSFVPPLPLFATQPLPVDVLPLGATFTVVEEFLVPLGGLKLMVVG